MTTIPSEVTLEPCPFCGGEVERVMPPCSDMSEYIRHVGDASCPVEFTAFTLDEDLSAAWNTRAALTSLPRDEAIEEAAKVAEQAYAHPGQPDDPHPDAVLVNSTVSQIAAAMQGGDWRVRGWGEGVWTGSKKQREALRAKFGGRCAYCGGPLDKMHADHLEPCVRITRDPWGQPLPAEECRMLKPERNAVSNMMPACAPCNLHKGGHSLEGWRDILQRSAAILRRDTSTFRAGERFGIIIADEKPVVFYFESLGATLERNPHG